MKKIIALLFAAIMMVSLMAPALAGRDPATCPHTNCGWKTKTAATCTTSGTDWYYCKDCGKNLYYRTTPKKGHAWTTKTTKYPTFKGMGKSHTYCTRCTAGYYTDLPRRDPATATTDEKNSARVSFGDNDLKTGKKGAYVIALKNELIKLGLYDENADKNKSAEEKKTYDADVVKAVKKFQKQYGLDQDGVAGIKTKVVLNER